MRDADCVAFLRWALPRLGLRWRGFRRVRRQVCRRVRMRFTELGLPDVAAYRRRLETEPAEWERLAPLCRVTISRFFRDRELFAELERTVLPALLERFGAATRATLSAWSAGCGAGEEPYSLTILARLSPALPGARLRIVGTDLDAVQLERARRAIYPESSLRDVPAAWREAAFTPADGGELRLEPPYRRGVELLQQDLRQETPAGPFHLVLCRNLVFTYWDEALQRQAVERIRRRLLPGGALVVGGHERLPGDLPSLRAWRRSIWQRT